MNVSREFTVEQLKLIRKGVSGWIGELEKPATKNEKGENVPLYPGRIPEGLSVSSVEGIPAEQLRAELTAMAGILLALANTE